MRYIILVLFNLPVIFLAFLNILTQYKLRKITRRKYYYQIILWLVILVVVVSSFPLYNYINGKDLLDSSELSLFDIIETTALILLFYIVNRQYQQIDRTERTVRDLNQELSIKLTSYEKRKKTTSK